MTPNVVSEEGKETPYRKRSVSSARFFIAESVISRIADHADIGLESEREIMGLIIGNIYRDDGGEYAVVQDIITADLISDEVSVRFDPEGMEGMFDELDEMGCGTSVVGWYHSHLDYGCFMSKTDIETQDGIFGGETGFALVIDPVRKEIKIFDSTYGDPKSIDMIVMEE